MNRLRITVALFGTYVAACSAHAGSYEKSVGSGGDADGGNELVCPVSDSGIFEETPTGACEGSGSCAIEVYNSCRPGLAFVPSTRPVFDCDCVSNRWRCVVASGGLGVVPCGDSGAPDR